MAHYDREGFSPHRRCTDRVVHRCLPIRSSAISDQLSAKGAEGRKLPANGPDCKGSNRFCDPLQDPPSLRLGHDAISGSQGHPLGHQLFSLTADGLFWPTQRRRKPPAFQKVSERIRLVGPAPASAAGQGGDVDQASQDPEAEAVYDVVGIFYIAAGFGHEEAAGLPHAVPVDGEGLAGLIWSLLRPAEDASGVA